MILSNQQDLLPDFINEMHGQNLSTERFCPFFAFRGGL